MIDVVRLLMVEFQFHNENNYKLIRVISYFFHNSL